MNSDSELFFGREALTERLTSHVMDLFVQAPTRFLAVVGASGSGKSSLVRAGLAVTLKRAGWEVIVITPTATPMKTLEATIDPLLIKNAERVLILVDQFEEVFTLCHDELERIAYIDKLLALAQEKMKKTSVVIALRADFYSHCAQYPLLRQAVAAEQEYIGQMTSEELRCAIEKPARQGGWEFEPGLVEVMLQDLSTHGSHEPEPGALPLLSHALLSTWEHRRGRMFTLNGYHASGGVQGAIAETAESVFTDQLNQTQQVIAREVFLRLTELGEGTEDTRRRAALNELVHQSGEAIELRAVLNTLAEARLITINEDNAEVAHEALIREWQRLHDWLTHDRDGLLLHRHLTESAQEWAERGNDPAELYRGARLAQAREWASANEERLNTAERTFLAASIEQEEHDALEREAQRQRELEASLKLAETKSRAAKQLRRRAFYLLGALVLAAIAALAASGFAIRSNADFTHVKAQRLAAEANSLMQSGADPQLIALLSLRSISTQHTLEGDTALDAAARLAFPVQIFNTDTNGVWSVAFSSDGKTILTGQDNNVRLWNVQSGQELRQFPGDINSLAVFSPDGRYILTGDATDKAKLWDLQSGQAIQQFSVGDAIIMSISYSPDGKYAVTGDTNNTATLWDIKTGQKIRQFIDTNSVLSIAFSPDSKFLVTTTFDKTATLWQVDTGAQVRVFTGHTGEVWAVAFSPDGKYIVTGSRDQTARLWDVQTGKELHKFAGHIDWVNAVAISPDGRYLATGSADKTVILWDIQTGLELHHFSGQTGAISSMSFSPDGRYLLSGSYDGSVWMWDLQQISGEYPPLLLNHSVYSVAFTPDGQRVVTAGDDNIVRLWDVSTGKVLQEFTVADNWGVFSVAVSPDGQFILTGDSDGTARLWSLQSGQIVQSFPVHQWGVSRVAFSPDGKYALTSSYDGIIRIWDLQTGMLKTKFVNDPTVNEQPIPYRPYGISFSPDGKTVLAPGDGSIVGLWDAQTGNLIREFNGQTGEVLGVAFSPDGRYAVSGGMDKVAVLWDVQTGKVLERLTGHTAFIYDVAFSPNGQFVVTASADNTIRLWDVKTGQELRRFTGHTGPVEWVAFSPDGKHFATASSDGTVRFWDVDYQDTVRYLCSHMLRDFSKDERVQYNITNNTPTCPTP